MCIYIPLWLLKWFLINNYKKMPPAKAKRSKGRNTLHHKYSQLRCPPTHDCIKLVWGAISTCCTISLFFILYLSPIT